MIKDRLTSALGILAVGLGGLLGLLAPCGVAQPSAPAGAGVDSLIRTGLRNSPAVRAAFHRYQAKLQRVPQVGTLPPPQVAFGVFVLPVETRVGPQRLKVSASQMFPWFGTLARRKAAEAQAAAAAYQDVEQERNKLIWQIQRHWYELYRLRRAQHFAQQQREWLSQLAQLATQRISSGSGTASEVVRIQMRTAERREEAAALGDRFAAERDRLARTLNRDSLPPLALPDSLRLPPPDTSGPLEQHPALQQLQHQQRTLALRKQVVQKERMPSLGVGVDYINLGSREQAVPGNGRDALAAGVRVSVPLWQQRYTARLDELTQQQQATADEAQSVRNQLASQAAEARATRREHRRKLQHYREQLQRGRRSLRLLRSEYSAGTAELDALLAMEAQLLSYQRQLHRSLAAARRAQARLHYLSAQPLNAYKDVIQTTEE